MHDSDFLTRTAPPPQSRNTPVRPWRGVIVVLFVLAVIVVGGLLVISAGRIAGGLSTTKVATAQAEEALREGDFLTADEALTSAEEGVAKARSGLALVVFLRPVPWVGTQLKGLSYSLEAGAEALSALHEAVGVVAEISAITADAQALLGITGDADVPYGELATSTRVALLEALHDAHPRLLSMQLKLSLAKSDLARLQELNVTPALSAAMSPFVEVIDPLINAVDLLTPFSAAITELAGLGEDKQLLLLFANDTELRPGGGFLGVFALATVRDGQIINLLAEDSYAVDALVADEGYQATPPLPLTRYLGSQKWYFRDSNWSPDFPSSAATSIQLLRQEIAYAGLPVPEVHGALMFTPTFIGRLLNLIGPVTIDGQTFTSENVADKLEYQVEIGYAEQGIPPHQRKEVVARLTDQVVDRVLELPASRWPELFVILSESFVTKEMALWSNDEAVQSVYRDANWTGEVVQEGDDLLMVVDANLGALKTDPKVDREISYSVLPTTAGLQATVSIEYTNNASFTWKTTRYRTYTRVFAPLGSTFVSAQGTLVNDKLLNPAGAVGAVDVVEDLGLTSFGAFTSIEPGESRTLSFTYILPPSVVEAVHDGIYQLDVIKQLGAATHDLSIDLDLGGAVTYASPAEEAEEWGNDTYNLETELDTDKSFTLRVK